MYHKNVNKTECTQQDFKTKDTIKLLWFSVLHIHLNCLVKKTFLQTSHLK